MKPKVSILQYTFLTACALLTISTSFAQTTYYWDGNDGTSGFGSATGTWAAPTTGTTTSGWSTSSTGVTGVNGNSVTTTTLDSLYFGTNTTDYGLGAGTINISGTVNAGSITFGNKNGAVILSGGTINLGAAGTITVGVNTTIESVISGAGTSFTKVGNPVLTLTAANTYTGATYIGSSTNGVLEVSILANGGVASGIGMSSSAASNLVLAANNQGILRYIGSTNASSDRNFTIGNTNYNGGFESSGTGTLTLTSTSAVSYITSNGARNFQLGGTNTGQNTLNAQLVNNGTGALAFSKSGAGTWVLANETNSYTGKTSIAGTLSVSKMSNYGVDSSIGKGTLGTAIGMSNGTLEYTGSGDSTDRSIEVNGGTATVLNNGTGALNFTGSTYNSAISTSINRTVALGGSNGGTISGTIQNNTGGGATINVNKTGSGTWVLQGTNTYTSTTTISAGTLQFAKVASLYNGNTASWTATNIRVANGGTLAFNVGGAGEFTGSDVGTLLTNLANSTNATTNGMAAGSNFGFDTTNASGGSFEISQVVANSGGAAGGARGLTKLGTGTLVLSNANTYSGTTTISAGKLHITNATATSATGTGVVNLSGGNTTTLSGTGISTGLLTVTNASRIAAGENTTGTNGNFGAAGTLSLGTTGGMTLTSANFDFDLASLTTVGNSVNDLIMTGGVLSLTGTEAFTFNLLDGTLDTSTAYTLISGASSYSFTSGDFSTWTTNFVNSSDYTASYSFSGNDLQVTFSAIPEPSTALLSALAGLLLFRRRR